MNEILERWGLWCRVGLGRPRVTSVKYEDGAVGEDFDEEAMLRLDALISSLGEPTAKFIEYVYSYEWPLKEAANKAGFRLEREAARILLTRALGRIEASMGKYG
jgi:DNA-directed RNA polymerase specialized sigma24 family protein